ncbi:MAG: FHA domain-containing protein [Planctomycetes bacterium]|nr:FHA domain-containing protein [Planctomycetota bacterium]
MTTKRAPQIVVQLIHIAGPMKGEIQNFTESVITIGRHPSCKMRLPADLTVVSRQHAEIVREGNQFRLIDHSANGTFVNGKRASDVLLKSGDVLEFSEQGPKVSFLAEICEGAIQEETPPAPPLPQKAVERTPSPQPPPPPPRQSEPVPPTAQTVKAPLIIQYGPTLRSFRELPVTIGKGSQCQFVLEHPTLAAQHVQIFFAQDRYWVKDLTGLRAVQINRQPVGDQAPIEANDELALTPKGPFFKFLGGGRLAEVSESAIEEPAPPGREAPKAPPTETIDGKRLESLFSKLRNIVKS